MNFNKTLLTAKAVNKKIANLKRKFGDKIKPRLKKWFADESIYPFNIFLFGLFLFPHHFIFNVPDFHIDILKLIRKKGHIGIAAPRGFAKSTLIDLLYISWIIIHKKYHFFVLISDTYTQAKVQLSTIKIEFETNKRIHWLYGDLRGDTWGSDELEFKGRVKLMAKGVGQKIRGLKYLKWRPQLVICDDLENDEQVDSYERRTKLKKWFLNNVIPGLARHGKIIVIGTILHTDSLLKNIVDKKEEFKSWNTIRYKALLSNNKSLWPELWTGANLRRMRDDPDFEYYVGSLVFAQEYQNKPRADEDKIIKEKWIQYYSLSRKKHGERGEDWMADGEVLSAFDLAIGQKKGSHFFGGITALRDKNGHFWILDIVRDKLTVGEQVDKVINNIINWSPDRTGIESNAYQDALRQIVISEGAKKNIYAKIKKIVTDKNKERRATIHSAKFEGGFVHIPSDHPNCNALVNEIVGFPAEPDDTFDALLLLFDMITKKKARTFGRKARAFR